MHVSINSIIFLINRLHFAAISHNIYSILIWMKNLKRFVNNIHLYMLKLQHKMLREYVSTWGWIQSWSSKCTQWGCINNSNTWKLNDTSSHKYRQGLDIYRRSVIVALSPMCTFLVTYCVGHVEKPTGNHLCDLHSKYRQETISWKVNKRCIWTFDYAHHFATSRLLWQRY